MYVLRKYEDESIISQHRGPGAAKAAMRRAIKRGISCALWYERCGQRQLVVQCNVSA